VVVGAALRVYNSPLLFALLKWGKKLRNKKALCPSAAPEKGMRECPRACVLHPEGDAKSPKLIFGAVGTKKKLASEFFDDVSSLSFTNCCRRSAAANFVPRPAIVAKAASPFFAENQTAVIFDWAKERRGRKSAGTIASC
jgi:hypothetical protein